MNFAGLQYYFEDRFDLVRFVKVVRDAGLLLILRIGPFVAAEWNFGSAFLCSLLAECPCVATGEHSYIYVGIYSADATQNQYKQKFLLNFGFFCCCIASYTCVFVQIKM